MTTPHLDAPSVASAGAEATPLRPTPAQIAAAWRAFRGDRKGMLLGPGPGFVEAIGAAMALDPRVVDRDALAEALHRVAQWADAYPVDVFSDPDAAYYARAAEVLAANGMALDRLSAAAMRRVVRGVGEIARGALEAAEHGRRGRGEGEKDG